MQKAIVAISFGTREPEQKRKCIDACVKAISAAYPSWSVYECFTSNLLRKRLREQGGSKVLSPDELLIALRKQGCQYVILQPLFMMEGKEYDKLLRLRLSFLPFMQVKVGKPLLRGEEDAREVLKEVQEKYETEQSEIVLLGYDQRLKSMKTYEKFCKEAERTSKKIVVTTLACGEELTRLPLETKAVWLIPFAIVPSSHLIHTLREEKKIGWQQQMRQQTCKLQVETRGLGHLSCVRKLFLERIEEQVREV